MKKMNNDKLDVDAEDESKHQKNLSETSHLDEIAEKSLAKWTREFGPWVVPPRTLVDTFRRAIDEAIALVRSENERVDAVWDMKLENDDLRRQNQELKDELARKG